MVVESFWILVVQYTLPVFHMGAGVGAEDFSELSMGHKKGGQVGAYIWAFRSAQPEVLCLGETGFRVDSILESGETGIWYFCHVYVVYVLFNERPGTLFPRPDCGSTLGIFPPAYARGVLRTQYVTRYGHFYSFSSSHRITFLR